MKNQLFASLVILGSLPSMAQQFTYEVVGSLMGLDREVSVSNLEISSQTVPAEYPLNDAVQTSLELEIKGNIRGRSYCAADSIIASSEKSVDGEYPNETKVHRISFVEVRNSGKSGIPLGGDFCGGGTFGKFKMKIFLEPSGFGSRETHKKWRLEIVDSKGGQHLYNATLNLKTGEWEGHYQVPD